MVCSLLRLLLCGHISEASVVQLNSLLRWVFPQRCWLQKTKKTFFIKIKSRVLRASRFESSPLPFHPAWFIRVSASSPIDTNSIENYGTRPSFLSPFALPLACHEGGWNVVRKCRKRFLRRSLKTTSFFLRIQSLVKRDWINIGFADFML